MGRSPKPLRVLVHPDIAQWAEFDTLRDQGHLIEQQLTPLDEYDLVLGPTCWHMTPKHRKYLKDAVQAARSKRYPKEK